MLLQSPRPGRVYWLTGLSGAGKTTLGSGFFHHLKTIKPNVVYLDGDVLREVFGGTRGHTPEERKALAMSYSRLCKMLAEQGIDVVCATISLFHEVHDWNRTNLPSYTEVYIKVPIEVLIQRDQKQLYSRALRGEVEHVMGIDVAIEEPREPDIIIENSGTRPPEKVLEELISRLT